MPRLLLLSLFLIARHLLPAQLELTESNLPIIVINTNGQSIQQEMKITADMGIVANPGGQLNHPGDPFNDYDGKIGIEYRGSTSQDLSDKKPYAIELRDTDDQDTSLPLLGMAPGEDWVLLAPFSDKSLMRDALTYIWAGRAMEWAPHTRYCELILNGEYKGVFVLTEKIKRDENRVDISKLDDDDNDGDQLTGGYILKLDKCTGAGCDGFYSEHAVDQSKLNFPFFQYHYPRADKITDAQKAYIHGWMDTFEDSFLVPDMDDPETGYRQYTDVNSFVNFLLINELTKNVDGYRLSTYFYKDKDSEYGKLKMGPVWDFNIALGNANYCGGDSPNGWALDFNLVCPGDGWQIPFWWHEMLEKDCEFRKAVRDRWLELRTSALSTDQIMGDIDSIAALLDEAQERNFTLYPILNTYVWPNAYIGASYEGEIWYLKTWLEQRLEWMDGTMEALATVGLYKPTDYFPPVAYPNPSDGPVLFDFYVRHSELVEIKIFNAAGQLAEILWDDEHSNGKNTLEWNRPAPAGIYFYQIFFNDKMVGNGKLIKT